MIYTTAAQALLLSMGSSTAFVRSRHPSVMEQRPVSNDSETLSYPGSSIKSGCASQQCIDSSPVRWPPWFGSQIKEHGGVVPTPLGVPHTLSPEFLACSPPERFVPCGFPVEFATMSRCLVLRLRRRAPCMHTCSHGVCEQGAHSGCVHVRRDIACTTATQGCQGAFVCARSLVSASARDVLTIRPRVRLQARGFGTRPVAVGFLNGHTASFRRATSLQPRNGTSAGIRRSFFASVKPATSGSQRQHRKQPTPGSVCGEAPKRFAPKQTGELARALRPANQLNQQPPFSSSTRQIPPNSKQPNKPPSTTNIHHGWCDERSERR